MKRVARRLSTGTSHVDEEALHSSRLGRGGTLQLVAGLASSCRGEGLGNVRGLSFSSSLFVQMVNGLDLRIHHELQVGTFVLMIKPLIQHSPYGGEPEGLEVISRLFWYRE